MEFNGSDRHTVGVEYEVQLVDRQTLDLTDGAPALLARLAGNPYVAAEYNMNTVEVVSRVDQDVHALEHHLCEQLRAIRDAAEGLGLRLCASATHPFSRRLASVTPGERYHEVELESGYAGYIQTVCATHVHVGVPDGETAIRLMRRVRSRLPLLLALSASSPFYWGEDTLFAAYRPRVLVAAHAYGTPPPLDDWGHFERIWHAARRASVFRTFKDMHWDIRPKPEFGTLEIRIADGQPRPRDTAALVALCRALVESARENPDAVELPFWIEQENAYRAAHDAIGARLIVDERGATREASVLLLELLDELLPVARRFGEEDYLDWLAELASGRKEASYRRQRRVYRESGSLRRVVEAVIGELEQELEGEPQMA